MDLLQTSRTILWTLASNCGRCSRSERSLSSSANCSSGSLAPKASGATTCHDALLKYVLNLVLSGVPKIHSTASTTAPSRPVDAMQARLSGTEQELPEQLRRVSLALGDAARDPGSAQFNAQLLALKDFDLVRLHLLGASLLYESVSQDILSNHAANLVYRYRDALGALTDAEERLALASLLREGNSYVPGWYWVRDMSDEKVAQLLENIAMLHPDEEVRTSTLNLLSSRPDLPGITRTNDLVSAALSQPSDEMCTAALDYAARYGDSTTADIIGSSELGIFLRSLRGRLS